MTEPQMNRPEPGTAGGLAPERPAAGPPTVPPQGASQPADAQPGAGGAGAGRTPAGAGSIPAAAGGADATAEANLDGARRLGGIGGVRAMAAMAWGAALVAGIGMVAVGVMLLAWPKATLTVVAILIGAALVVTGLLSLFNGATARGDSGGSRAAEIVIGLLSVIAGLYCLKHHALTVLAVALVVGVLWIIHGIGDIIVAMAAGDVPGRGLKAVAGVFSLAAGLVILFWPGLSLVLLLTILGAWLIFYGVALAALAFWLRRGARPAARTSQLAAA